MNPNEFMSRMKELAEIGRAKDNVLTKAEIADYCGNMSLTAEQLGLVYDFLTEHHVEVRGYKKSAGSTAAQTDGEETAPKGTSADSRYLRIYRRELRGLPLYSPEEVEALFERLRAGEEEVIHRVVEAHLNRVVTIAGRYKGRGVLLEDLIQEGNLELMSCVSMLCGSAEAVDIKKEIDKAVKNRLIQLVDEAVAGTDSESSILARVNLLLEATRAFAEENGRIATVQELAEFTHMDMDEIEMYVELSNGEIEIGKVSL